MGRFRYPVIALLLALVVLLAYPGMLANEVMFPDDGDGINHVSSLKAAYLGEDSYLAECWGVGKIGAPQAWQVARGGESIIVAVLDTGIDENHRDLAGKVILEVNFSDSPTCDDLYGHGTHTAGIIAGIAPECRLMNVKVCDDVGRCEASAAARGIIWAVNNGANVINIGFCVKSSPYLELAINYAWSQGVVIVAAAGNDGKSTPVYPAYYDNCLAVASINGNDSLALLSNHGDWVDVAAPGSNIYSTQPQNQYGYKSGTSSAAAHVSGVAALVCSVAEDTNGGGVINDEVRQAMENNCSPLSVAGTGKGCINASEAVTAVTSSN